MRRIVTLLGAIAAALALGGMLRARRRARAEQGAEADGADRLRARLSQERARSGPEAAPAHGEPGRVPSLGAIAADLAELDAIVSAEEARSDRPLASVGSEETAAGETATAAAPASEPVGEVRRRVHEAARTAARRMRG